MSYGPFDGTTCTLPSSQSATRSTVKVGSVSEYQWKASLTLPSAGQYCYRVLLGGTDLLGTGNSPVFTTQAAAGSTAAVLVRGLRRLGARRRERQQPGSAEPARHARGQRRPLRGHDRRQRLPVRQPDELRRPAAGRSGDGRDLRRALLARPGRIDAALHGIRQPWPQRHGARGSDELAAGRRRLELGRPLPERRLLLRQRHDVRRTTRARGTRSTPAPPASTCSRRPGATPTPATRASTRTTTRRTSRRARPSTTGCSPTSSRTRPASSSRSRTIRSTRTTRARAPTRSSQGSSSLEGLLAQYGVNVAFNGHSHVYERNIASAPGNPITYITGGGGATLEPIGPCHAFDAFGLGWSPTKLKGTSCGGAPAPTSATQVFHFIKVTVVGHDGHGGADRRARADVRRADVLLRQHDCGHRSSTAGRRARRTRARATFSFHSTVAPATFTCSIDGADAAAVHEPGHLQRPRGRQPFVLRDRHGRFGDRSDARRPHLGHRRDGTDRARRRSSPRRSGRAPSA